MRGVLTCCLQIVVGSGLLYANYHFFLRNKKFHAYNRYYLLIAVVLSILIPLLNIPIYVPYGKPSLVVETWTILSSAHKNPVQIPNDSSVGGALTLQNLLLCFYILFALVFITRIVGAIVRVTKLLNKYPIEKTGDVCFINTTEPNAPFSFFKWMFWNRNIELESLTGRQMFRHELFHIRQRHSWDIVFMETVTSILWINPFFYLLKKELRTIHEFLADEFATKQNDKWTYAELLVTQLLGS